MSKLSLADLEALPAPQLAAQWARAGAALEAAKARHDLVHAALDARYRKRALRVLARLDKASGTVHLIDAGLDVAVEIPARSRTDRAELENAIALAENAGVAWRGVVDIAVKPAALPGLPAAISTAFMKAVACRLGKLAFTIRQAKPAARPAKAAHLGKAA